MFRRRLILTVGSLLALGGAGLARLPQLRVGTQGLPRHPFAQAETPAAGVIKSETKMVLVDVVVTDKKQHYLKDLTQKDFHVFEDGAEQPITSFSRETNLDRSAPGRPRYMVLFFEDAGLASDGQMAERDAAVKFVQDTASPDRMVAVMDFGGFLRVDQNFTANQDLLLKAVRNVKVSENQTNPASGPAIGAGSLIRTGAGSPGQQQTEFALRNLLLALREASNMLGAAPGRKTLLFISAGFDLRSDLQTEFQDTLDALNAANIAVYPVDPTGFTSAPGDAQPHDTVVRRDGNRMPAPVRAAGGGSNDSILYALAAKTGGFPVVNTNDLAAGMTKISEEIDEYYLLGYAPPHPGQEGAYHKIHVKVDRPGAEVRARNGYSEPKGPDQLAGKTEGVALEAQAGNFEAGEIPVHVRVPYFYIRPGVARVNLSVSIPGSAIEFEKQKGNFESQINVMGIAYRDDKSVAARFSDTVDLRFDKDEKQSVAENSFDYQNSFKIAPGDYTFKLVLNAGGAKFGKYVTPLIVDPFSGRQLTLSGPAFGGTVIASPLNGADIDPALIEGSAPMVAGGMQLVPSSSNQFKKGSEPIVYVEVYDPVLQNGNPQLGVQFDIVNWTNNQKVFSSTTIPITEYVKPGNPLVPVILKMPIDKLPAGDYALRIWAQDSARNTSSVQGGNFFIE